MRIFFSSVILCLCCTLASQPVHAQKWNFFKSGLSAPRVRMFSVATQAKIKRAIWRAALLRRPDHFRTITCLPGGYSFISPKALLPKPSMLKRQDKIPPLPFKGSELLMFRGMRLDADGKQLRHILRAGMKVSKSHHFCMIPYQGKTYPPGTKAIYTALDPQNAVSFAIKTDDDLDKKPFLPVVFHLKRTDWGTFVAVPHDIPSSWIYHVSALLQIDGRLTWGEITLGPNGHFTFMPYPSAQP